MKIHRRWIFDWLVSGFFVAVAFFASKLVEAAYTTAPVIPMIFTLAVFLTALTTHGYIYGIVASLGSVLVVSYAFVFPFNKFDFVIAENVLIALVIFVVTTITSTLTTRLRQQEQLRAESEKEFMRANLLRAISHDLRTPLTSIYGASSAIMENYDVLSKAQQMKLLGEMKEDSEWLIRMVENLLSVTRIGKEAGASLVKVPVVLEELTEEVLSKFHKYYPAQKVSVEIPEEFIRVDMDAMLIEQVLINLFENAVQHAHGMTKLEFRIYMMEDNAVFEVADNGLGISEDTMENLFHGKTDKSFISIGDHKRSLGIGLSVCTTIIKAHGGEITAENREGGGALFRFTLPGKEGVDE